MRADLNPGADEARAWLEEELAKDEYHDGRSVLERIFRWLAEQLEGLQNSTVDGPGFGLPPAAVAFLAAVVVAAIVLLLTRIRAERRAVEDSTGVLGELALTASQYRDRGAAALREGRWNDAVVEYTRAIARDAADRTLLADAPSLTAHEVGQRLTPVFPAHEAAVGRSMDLFDAVRYGRYAASADDADHLAETCKTLRDARPVLDPLTPVEDRPSAAPAGAGGPQ
jgi:hypothetical protein